MLTRPKQPMQAKQPMAAEPMGQSRPNQPPSGLKPLQPPVQQPSPWLPPNMQQQMQPQRNTQVPTLPSQNQAGLNHEVIKRYLQSRLKLGF